MDSPSPASGAVAPAPDGAAPSPPASAETLPAGPSSPPLRQTLEWLRRPLPLLEACGRRHGDVFTLRLAGTPPLVVLSHPDAIRAVFTGDPELLRSGEANALLQATLGRHSILVLDGRDHLRERRLMLPAFHGERMRRYEEVIAWIAEREVARWPAGRSFPTAPSFRAITLEVIVRAVFGVEEPGRVAPLTRALRRLLDATTAPVRVFTLLLLDPDGPTVRTWQRWAPTLRRVDSLLYEEIRRRRLDPATAERGDILSQLLQARDEGGRPMSDRQLRDELMTLLVAGHETTATGLAWAVERLARDRAAFDRLAAETAEGGEEWVDAVVKETLRVRPVLPFVVRQLAAPVEIAGWRLPAGVRVAPCIHLVHRRPELYPQPELFRPERFLERPADTYTWIPFGGGTRRCLGGAFATFEMKVVLRTIARAGRPHPADPSDEPVGRRGLTLTPGRGARVVWERTAA
jgi:cytochrome P450